MYASKDNDQFLIQHPNQNQSSQEFDMTITEKHANANVKPEKLTPPSNISQLRLSPSFSQNYGAKRILINVPVGKPAKEKFFRVHPDPTNTFDAVILELKEQNETYVVLPELTDLMGSLVRNVRLYLAVDRSGNPFLIPVVLPDFDGSQNKWHASLEQAISRAKDNWVRISANKTLGSYDVHVAHGVLADPVWPEEDLNTLVEIAFRGRMIMEETHPIVHSIMGRV